MIDLSLIQKIRDLAPWHHSIQLTDTLNTGQVFSPDKQLAPENNGGVSLLDLHPEFSELIESLYPEGFDGKSFLDCACNGGGYCFWMREKGAQKCFGFDVREHWIEQARFVQRERKVAPVDEIEFAVMDLYDLGKRKPELYDLTLFKGIFYHLPDPITGLRLAAERTREVLILNTQTAWGHPDGLLKAGTESTELVMSGVHGPQWSPTGPQALYPTLKWLGFQEIVVRYHRQECPGSPYGRMELIASKIPGKLKNVKIY